MAGLSHVPVSAAGLAINIIKTPSDITEHREEVELRKMFCPLRAESVGINIQTNPVLNHYT